MSRSTRLARQLGATVPPAVRVTMGLATVAVTALRVLVLVTSLMPVFAVLLAVLGAGQYRSPSRRLARAVSEVRRRRG